MVNVLKTSDLSPLHATAESYARKLKKAVIPMANIYNIFVKSEGRWAVQRTTGWPQDCRIVGAAIQKTPFALILYIYHPDFLSVPPRTEPPTLKLNWERSG